MQGRGEIAPTIARTARHEREKRFKPLAPRLRPELCLYPRARFLVGNNRRWTRDRLLPQAWRRMTTQATGLAEAGGEPPAGFLGRDARKR